MSTLTEPFPSSKAISFDDVLGHPLVVSVNSGELFEITHPSQPVLFDTEIVSLDTAQFGQAEIDRPVKRSISNKVMETRKQRPPQTEGEATSASTDTAQQRNILKKTEAKKQTKKAPKRVSAPEISEEPNDDDDDSIEGLAVMDERNLLSSQRHQALDCNRSAATKCRNESNGQCLQDVRMGSAELSRLRTSMRWTSVRPPTSACTKKVHFAADLEQARSFFQLDSPNSISIKPSVDHYEDGVCDRKLLYHDGHAARRPAYIWKILTPDTVPDTDGYKRNPVMIRNLSLTDSQDAIQGSVYVASIAVAKTVVCYFTCDEWNTRLETSASYCTDASPETAITGYDSFTFLIDISDIMNLESGALCCCVQCIINGTDFWNNNEWTTFQVYFSMHLSYNELALGSTDYSKVPSLLEAISQQVPSRELLNYRTIRRCRTKGQQQNDPKRLTSPEYHSLVMILLQSIKKASKAIDLEAEETSSRKGNGHRFGCNVKSTEPLRSKTYRGVQSADISFSKTSTTNFRT